MHPSLLGSSRLPTATRAARCGLDARRKVCEHWLEQSDRLVRAARHQAVAPLLAPHPAARPAVDIGDARPVERCRASDVIVVVRVAAVHDHVTGREQRHEVAEHGIDHPRWDH